MDPHPVPDRATTFFNAVIHVEKLNLKIDTIHEALVNSIAGKECLLRNIINQIAAKGANKSLLNCYELYENYVTSIVFDLRKGNLIFENAVQFFELLAEEKKQPELKSKLPFSTASWKTKWERQLKGLLDAFNTHLECFVITRNLPAAHDINPFFLSADPCELFRRADAFCSRLLGTYGLRGRIFSMGGQFDGTLKLDDGTSVAGVKFDVPIENKLDYWSATTTPGVYDKVDFSDVWTVHRFHVPTATSGTKKLSITLPYSPPAIDIRKYDEKTWQPSDRPLSTGSTLKEFGSFVEIARAGGGFAFFSGAWDEGHEDDDGSNKANEPNLSKVTEHREFVERRIRDVRDGSVILAKVKRPEVGLAKGGWLGNRVTLYRSTSRLAGSFRTWLQTTKTITFPVPPQGEIIYVVASLAPRLEARTGFPGAGTLNNWLFGNAVRVLKPGANITEDEVLRKQVVVGVN